MSASTRRAGTCGRVSWGSRAQGKRHRARAGARLACVAWSVVLAGTSTAGSALMLCSPLTWRTQRIYAMSACQVVERDGRVRQDRQDRQDRQGGQGGQGGQTCPPKRLLPQELVDGCRQC